MSDTTEHAPDLPEDTDALKSIIGTRCNVLQTIRHLLIRSESFREERELPGSDFHRGEQCTLARHTQIPFQDLDVRVQNLDYNYRKAIGRNALGNFDTDNKLTSE